MINLIEIINQNNNYVFLFYVNQFVVFIMFYLCINIINSNEKKSIIKCDVSISVVKILFLMKFLNCDNSATKQHSNKA